jgi:hypothetical protein
MLSRYNKAGTGFLLGLFLGYFGLLFALVIRSGENKKLEQQRHEEQLAVLRDAAEPTEKRDPGAYRECPYCAETILAKAKVCKHCHKDIVPAAGSEYMSAADLEALARGHRG